MAIDGVSLSIMLVKEIASDLFFAGELLVSLEHANEGLRTSLGQYKELLALGTEGEGLREKAANVTESSQAGFLMLLNKLQEKSERLGLKQSTFFIGRVIHAIEAQGFDRWDGRETQFLRELMHNELSSLTLLRILNGSATDRYANPRDGWAQTIARFPDSVEDIDEAAICFALSRYAACVFHVMRVVELGVREVSRLAGLNDRAPSWGAALQFVRKAVLETKRNDRPNPINEHFDFFQSVLPEMQAIQRAWRNRVSHNETHLIVLTSTYTSEHADEIFHSSRVFMNHVGQELISRGMHTA